MRRNPARSFGAGLLATVWFAVTPATCLAGDGTGDSAALLAKDFPEGAVQSDAAADDALRRASEAREEAEKKFADQERVCYSRFFVNACLSDAKEERRLALSRVKRVEIEANEFKRASRVKEHDRMAEQKAAGEHSIQVSSENKPKTTDERVAEHEEKLKQIEEKEAAEAPERARNVAAYEEKVKEAEERKRKAAEQKPK